MVRINIVEPEILTDQHLLAEYVETRMLCSNLLRTLRSKNGFVPAKVPPEYTLNTGHCYFFYNKGKYLHDRYLLIKSELSRRGIKNDYDFPTEVWPKDLFNDWVPVEKDFNLVKARITERLQRKIWWYRYNRLPITELFLNQFGYIK
jgi:deoxyribonuclease (pyrimidine dimer)